MSWLQGFLARLPDEATLRAAHRASMRHRARIEASLRCGCFCCFCCFAGFAPAEIDEWTDDGETALCPRCGIDAVLGDAGDFAPDAAFLQAMHRRWFDAIDLED